MSRCIGWEGCGASLYLDESSSNIACNGKWSRCFKKGGVRNGESVTSIINQKNNNNSKSESGGKMNFIRYGKKIPHTITNIPNSGVHLGFSRGYYSASFILYITSLRKLCVSPSLSLTGTTSTMTISPPEDGDNTNTGVRRCVAYDFNGRFKNKSYNHRDENGEEISNIKEYYEQKMMEKENN